MQNADMLINKADMLIIKADMLINKTSRRYEYKMFKSGGKFAALLHHNSG